MSGTAEGLGAIEARRQSVADARADRDVAMAEQRRIRKETRQQSIEDEQRRRREQLEDVEAGVRLENRLKKELRGQAFPIGVQQAAGTKVKAAPGSAPESFRLEADMPVHQTVSSYERQFFSNKKPGMAGLVGEDRSDNAQRIRDIMSQMER